MTTDINIEILVGKVQANREGWVSISLDGFHRQSEKFLNRS